MRPITGEKIAVSLRIPEPRRTDGANLCYVLVTSVICAGCQSRLIIEAVSEILEHENTVKAKNAGLSGTVVRGIVLLVALSAYIASIARFLYTGSWGVHALAFAVAAFVLIAL